MLDQSERRELAHRLLTAKEGEPVELKLESSPHPSSNGERNTSSAGNIPISEIFSEISQISPHLLELAVERAYRKRLEHENMHLMQALEAKED